MKIPIQKRGDHKSQEIQCTFPNSDPSLGYPKDLEELRDPKMGEMEKCCGPLSSIWGFHLYDSSLSVHLKRNFAGFGMGFEFQNLCKPCLICWIWKGDLSFIHSFVDLTDCQFLSLDMTA
ncbi:hypothetical protein OSB04_un001259 [Centaurea solstitialis]|uniref:Uncharacterized protein n=1 Tax=Centaurea solstitialis TaxID=347529 RepID=A0AA38VUS9_9ASTR|nr:hypothetical protein OSB04_un001259 [Centaurea solstitialis]